MIAVSILAFVARVIVLILTYWFPGLLILPPIISHDLLGVIQYSFTLAVVEVEP